MAITANFKTSLLTVVSLSLLLVGCVHPKVTYVTSPEGDMDGKIKFRLAATRVVLGKASQDPKDLKKTYLDTNSTAGLEIDKVSLIEVPREDDTALYAIVPVSQWLWTVDTNLSATYFDNTRLVQKLGTQVEDNRIEVVQAIGSIAVAAVALLAPQPVQTEIRPPATNKIEIPTSIDIEPDQTEWKELPNNSGWFYMVTGSVGPDKDSVKRNTYFEKYKDQFFSVFTSTKTIPTSSCLQANLKIGRLEKAFLANIPKGSDFREKLIDVRSWPILVADYNNVRTYEVPYKGSISAHTLCGADSLTEKSDAKSGMDILAELMKQAKAIKDAQDAKKEKANKK